MDKAVTELTLCRNAGGLQEALIQLWVSVGGSGWLTLSTTSMASLLILQDITEDPNTSLLT